MPPDVSNPPPLSPHRQRKRDAMLRAILDAARAIMREQGVAALSVQELARRMDLRAPSLYNYFDGKMEIYDALFRDGFELYGDYLEKYSASAKTFQEYVRAGFESYLSFAKENPELYQLCFERPVPGFVPSETSLQVSVRLLEQNYRRAMEYKAELRTDLPIETVVDLLIAMMHGITAMHLANEPDVPLGQGRFGNIIPAAMELLEKAWLPREPQP